jgi:hypothetical protein
MMQSSRTIGITTGKELISVCSQHQIGKSEIFRPDNSKPKRKDYAAQRKLKQQTRDASFSF